MSLRINHNIASMTGQRQLLSNDQRIRSSLARLSTGLQINSAADDPNGLVLSEQMRAQLVGLEQAIDNGETAVAMVQTADAALDELTGLLLKARELTLHAANEATNDNAQLHADQAELDDIISSIDRIATYTQFGSKTILDGSLDGLVHNQNGQAAMDPVFQRITTGTLANNPDITVGSFQLHLDELGAAHLRSSGNPDLQLNLHEDPHGAPASIVYTLDESDPHNAGFSGIVLEVDRALIAAATGSVQTYDFQIDDGALFQIGANAEQRAGITIASVHSQELGRNLADSEPLTSLADLSSHKSGALVNGHFIQATHVIDDALDTIGGMRGHLGAFIADTQASSIESMRIANENLTAAESTIRDVDFAQASAAFTKDNILVQSATAMLTQANQLPQGVLQFLGSDGG